MLNFIFLQEALGADTVADCVLSYVEMLLPRLLDLLKGLNTAEGDTRLRKHCHRITHVTSLLLDILSFSLVMYRNQVFVLDFDKHGFNQSEICEP